MTKFMGIFPGREELNKALYSFSYKRMVFFILLCVAFLVSLFLILNKINHTYTFERPLSGGSFEEGVVGSPRFINPVLATSNTDRDITALVFAGLMKKSTDGSMQPDLAGTFTISPDKLTYTFTLRDGAVFHDKTPVTADDVIFTITSIQDGKLKSPHQANWQNVAVTKIDDRTVEFRLGSPYASFIEYTSIGIVPAHLWQDLDTDDFTFSDTNLLAVGAGPYRITHIEKKKNGLIESITLKRFSGYAQKAPYIEKITFVFYKNEGDLVRAFEKNRIDHINAISAEAARKLQNKGEAVMSTPLSRIFGLFFNANKQDLFRDKEVVAAINLGIHREEIIQSVLYGYGQTVTGPIPPKMYIRETEPQMKDSATRTQEANAILDKDGWVRGEDGIRSKNGKVLRFSISTGDARELQSTAEIIKKDLREIGIDVEIKIFEIGSLNQSVIRPRDYESLFFGQIVNNEDDLFAFWHSSQRNDPGLNIASYTNSKVDGILQKLISANAEEERTQNLQALDKEITSDMPAIFIYAPDFIYVTDGRVQGISIENIVFPSERFNHVTDWYINTETIWKFLQH